MGTSKTLGGDRLGSGKKQKVSLHGYERSTHDLGYIWRSSMAVGTLVPYMSMVGLPGDNFDIQLNADVKTYPTVGPMFGSFKLQLDVFVCPIRLYNSWLHNNKLNVGMKMEKVKLPVVSLTTKGLDLTSDVPLEMQQINQSSLLAYLGIRGVNKGIDANTELTKEFNGVPYLAYWDIYKNYYANKQELYGNMIGASNYIDETIGTWTLKNSAGNIIKTGTGSSSFNSEILTNYALTMQGKNLTAVDVKIILNNGAPVNMEDVFVTTSFQALPNNINVIIGYFRSNVTSSSEIRFISKTPPEANISVQRFDLDNIDDMRENILKVSGGIPYVIDGQTQLPYGLPLLKGADGYPLSKGSQMGLGLKTYQSDVFNNWLSSEWIDGVDGINKITAISTSADYFTLDTLNLSKKVYDMLNRIAVSGGTYNDWMEANWDSKPYNSAETPVYMGGLSKEVVFQEVVSTAQSGDENPLGSLAGKGGMAKKHKGGNVNIKITEPSYIMGIVSLTPRIDYSQGNAWDMELKNMNDFHKPALDGIGFQDLVTEQMAFWDTEANGTKHSAGKQPAWINYQTNFNKCYGNFADARKEMYMTLNRRYSHDNVGRIKDLTTYIDPVKYNYIFAQTSLDAQNFWVQLGVDVTARRKMSAKIMPNL